MVDKGFLAAGYNYMTLGGIGYANGSTCTPVSDCNITRNATGFLQVDPVRFPGGNDGFAEMTKQIRAMGFKWGSYTEAGTSGCNGAKRISLLHNSWLFQEDAMKMRDFLDFLLRCPELWGN